MSLGDRPGVGVETSNQVYFNGLHGGLLGALICDMTAKQYFFQ
jgi:hypothetical protein